ncbi:hypothetical protein TCAL_08793 [Tigriopus californicus]|uniref:Uncharacterized protein n=1 Tax=Tigriopus californicus TaxID=6832 RepID=A0A553PHX8_TIGCA|nr:hypothetical protein TCAL_08793 [Tigriopus californicus]
MESQLSFKVLILGPKRVGKSSLVRKFVFDDDNGPPTLRAKLKIWDTSGQERFEAVCRAYYHSTEAAILCFDPTNEVSWKEMQSILNKFNVINPDSKIYLCGTKFDILEDELKEPCVDPELVQEFANSLNCGAKVFMETSSKLGTHIDELFRTLTEDCLSDLAETSPEVLNTAISVESQKRRSWCCRQFRLY